MLRSEIKPRTEYAVREKRQPGIPFQRVRVLEHVRGNKWKAEWIDPNPGLVDYIESGQIVVPWNEHRVFLKEEAQAQALDAYNLRHGYEGDNPVAEAIEQVISATGEQGVTFYRGLLSGPPERIDRIKIRASMGVGEQSPPGYIDRKGMLHLPMMRRWRWPADSAPLNPRPCCSTSKLPSASGRPRRRAQATNTSCPSLMSTELRGQSSGNGLVTIPR
jgi:hypothetical protein